MHARVNVYVDIALFDNVSVVGIMDDDADMYVDMCVLVDMGADMDASCECGCVC